MPPSPLRGEGSGVRGEPAPARRTIAAVIVFQFLVAVYGGYFGAGIGILMLSSLGLMGLGDIHRMNALKTFLAACINGISVAWFVFKDAVDWRFALVMAVAAVGGGYLGARVARRLDRNLVRWIVIAIGFGLAGYFFYEQWAGASQLDPPGVSAPGSPSTNSSTRNGGRSGKARPSSARPTL